MPDLISQTREFLRLKWDQKSPLLLGYSGGPDSKVLLDVLLQLKVRPHLAHIDHGWRDESAQEAKELQREAEALGLIFHTIRLEPDPRESVAREKRLEFFLGLWKKHSFQAILLGHQADDLAETSLKRVLEGAYLAYLGGMSAVSEWKGMPIWRPFLAASKKEIMTYLEQNKLQAISDRTNFDPAYLRARMRLEILPSLARSFGKEITKNLTLLGKRAFELKDYLDLKTDAALSGLKKGPWGWVLPCLSTERLEVRHLLQRLKIPLTREVLEKLVDALVRKVPNRRFDKFFLADRGCFIYLNKKFPLFKEPIAIREGVFQSGDWMVEVTRGDLGPSGKSDLWLGEFWWTLPEGDYMLQMAASEDSQRIGKRFNQQKIPAFLRASLPHLYERGQWVSDFFSLKPSKGYKVRFSVLSNNSSLE